MDISSGIKIGASTDIIVDTTVCGGITATKKVVALAEANNMRCELQSWGATLTQAANLHIILSNTCTTYFEQAYPYEPFEFGAKDVIRIDKDGYVHAPTKPGIRIDLDWNEIKRLTIKKFDSNINK